MAINYFGNEDLEKLLTLLHTEFGKYVKAVSGKDLSTEDFTTALKGKLEGIDLSQYSTTSEMNSAINTAIASVTGLKFEKVQALPTTGQNGIIYLVPKSTAGTNDSYDEYYWDADNNKFEFFGTTAIDLSGYVKTTDLVEISASDVESKWNTIFS